MATTNLITKTIGDLTWQHGNGTPNHTAKLGSVYVDKDTGLHYRNNDGATGWDEDNTLSNSDATNLDNLSGTNTGDEVSATTTVEGIAELATQTEVNTGADAVRIVTPDTLEDKTMGTYTGTTITDNVTLKTVLQELETAAEATPTLSSVLSSGNSAGANIIDMNGNAIKFFEAFGDIVSIYATDENLILDSDLGQVEIRADAGLRVFNGTIIDGTSLNFANVPANNVTVLSSNGTGPGWPGTTGLIKGYLTAVQPTANRVYTLKDESGTIAFLSDITGTNSGTNTGDQTITLTGDVTGSGTGSFAATIADNSVTNAKAANMAAWTLKLRNNAATGDPEDVKISALTAGSFGSGDKIIFEESTGELRQVDYDDLPGAAGITPINGSVATTNATPAEVDKIDDLPDDSVIVIDLYATAKADDDTEWGTWEKTIAVTKFGGTVVIRQNDSMHHKSSAGLNANSITFTVNAGDIDIDVTGVAAKNIQWNTNYIIRETSTN